MVNLRQLENKAVAVGLLIDNVVNALPDNEDAEDLENNYSELYSMILDIKESLDAVLSDFEK